MTIRSLIASMKIMRRETSYMCTMSMIEDPIAQNTGEEGNTTAFGTSCLKPATWVGPAPPNAKMTKSSGL